MPINFIIGFVGRQGSSYLEGLIDSHPDAQCLGELMVVPEAAADRLAFIDRTVHSTTAKATGFKLAMEHVVANPGVIGFLERHEYRAIILQRHNKVDQFISMKLAKENSSWRSDFGEYKIHQITIDPEELLSEIQDFTMRDEYIDDALKRLPSIKLFYEDLISGAGIQKSLEFLDLRPMALTSRYKRQRQYPRRETVANYDEMVRYFSGTQIGNFFLSEEQWPR